MQYDLNIVSDNTNSYQFVFRNANRTPINLTGSSVAIIYASSAETFTKPLTILDALGGKCGLELTPQETINLTNSFKYRIVYTTADAKKYTVLQGNFRVVEEV